ncbi:cytochrome P450 [Chlorella sorokiniana]|uniref:Cytochrome P450 n=1 Tax=Chlorella sorokiniana TaxID=3076 RepID=A0A2P6TN45_CHLSO|nr:cytochrome P450 [Chlorella sorokiniana]|eukprot:PRW50749.1 cytochrome P450 [Chlorella sorokiniana]
MLNGLLLGLAGAGALLVSLSALRWLRWLRRVERSGVTMAPLPPAAGLMGHAPQIAGRRFHRTLLQWERSLGPIFMLKAFTARFVVVTDPRLVQQLLRGGDEVDKSLVTYSALNPLISDKGHPSVFTASSRSPLWRLVRKGTALGFSSRCLRASFPDIQAVCGELLAQLQAAGPDTVLYMSELLSRGTLDLIGRVGIQANLQAVQAFRPDGVAQGTQGDEMYRTLQLCVKEADLRWTDPLRPLQLWKQEVRDGNAQYRRFQAIMKRLLADIRARGPPAEEDGSICAHLLRVRGEDGQPLPDDRVLPELATFISAGMDTTAHTMAFTLYLIARHPDVDSKLCAELEAAGLLATPQAPQPRQVAWEDLSRLPYLTAVVKESMRMLPVGANGSALEAKRDMQLGPYAIPAGTLLWLCMFVVHNSPRYWQDPGSFRPERFLDPGAEHVQPELAAANEQGLPYAAPCAAAQDGTAGRAAGRGGGAAQPLRFFPFSQGPRDCIGQSLARVNITATLATLLGRYRFHLAPEAEGPGGMQDVLGLTLHPEGGLPMRAVPRVAQQA